MFCIFSKTFFEDLLPWEREYTKKDKRIICICILVPLVLCPIIMSLPSRSDISKVTFVLASQLPEEERRVLFPLIDIQAHECPRVK